MARNDSFCGACGAPSAEALEAAYVQVRTDHTRVRRASAAMTIVFAGVLAAIVGVAAAGIPEANLSMLTLLAAEVAVGTLAVWRLGLRSVRATLGRWPAAKHVACAVPVAAVSVASAIGYLALLRSIVPPSAAGAEPAATLPSFLLLVVIVVPLCEEWLCRGVLWVALRPITSLGVTLGITALLFALLHGLNGAYLFEIPHRFASGLLFGWLRARSGSLLPSITAHALHNGAVVLLDV